jgi:FkbM family methyltransferase
MKHAVALYELVRRRAPWLHGLIRGGLRIAVRALSVVMRVSLPSDQPYGYQFLLGQHEPGTTRLLKQQVRPGAVVVDVGAHLGYFTRLLAKRAGKGGAVYAFEPNPDTYAVLRRNTSRMKNVNAIMAAVLDKEAEVTLYQDSGSTMMASLWAANTRGAPTGISAQATSLDEVLDGARLDLVKIDAEGAEPEVLVGMRHLLDRSPQAALLVECSPPALQGRGASAGALYSQLRQLGFDISGVDEKTREVIELPTVSDLDRMLRQGRKYVNLWCTRPTPP